MAITGTVVKKHLEKASTFFELFAGGIRGLSMLLILKELITQLNQRLEAANIEVIKPCHVFDLIAGTSVGGLIAIMLGRLEMDVDKCISAFSRLTLLCFKSKSNLLSDHMGSALRKGTKSIALAQVNNSSRDLGITTPEQWVVTRVQSIGAIKFVDGELSDNNPVREVYEEVSKMWYHKPGDPNSVPRCLVSIGIGGEKPIDTPC
ncbi:acyl transferase/acyl hydrolase/lysophospholipase [Leptodontidium sp. 2 PMI_412]|nr:acyl transferase/acyl hydrolase/lysophospholipase [Leptodontidium sp. 2 PMI_412]